MNFAIALRLPSIIGALVLANLWLLPSGAQETKKVQLNEQTEFSAEESRFEHPVPLNKSAKYALANEQSIADLLREEKLSVETMPDDWFTASEVHLSTSLDASGLVVMGDRIARGPYTSAFWVLRKSPGGYKLVFHKDAHSLQLQRTSRNGLRNIMTAVATLHDNSTIDYEFDGKTYRAFKRTLQPNGYETLPKASNYTTREDFVQVPGQDPEPILVRARAWIWQHWRNHQSSYARVATRDDDGEQQDCSYFIDSSSENKGMQVTIKIHRIVWEQDSPTEPRHKIIEDQIVIADHVQRMAPSLADSQDPEVFSEQQKIDSSKYRLHFLAQETYDLLTL